MPQPQTTLRHAFLTHIAYFAATLNSDGSVTDKHDWPYTDLVNWAHARGVKVVLVARNFHTSQVTTLLSSASNRQNAINNLLSEVQAAGADGVNIDFEYVAATQRTNYVTFMRDLTNTFHSNISGSHVSTDTPAVDWWGSYDYDGLADATDGLMIMAYDYHWSGGPEAGPVSPYDDSSTWGSSLNVVTTVEDYLTKTGDDRSKLILGVPYYGYDWPVSSGNIPASTTGNGTAKSYATIQGELEAGKTRLWDQASKTPYVKYGSYHQIWYDDASSLNYKYDLVNSANLQGIGIWALGYDGDYPDLWNRIQAKFASPTSFNLLTPPNNSTINDARPTLDWEDSEDGNVYYKLRYSKNSNFSSFDEIEGISESKYTFTENLDSAKYYWKVAALSSSGGERWSDQTWNFTYDPNGNPELSILTAAGPGGGPHIRAFTHYGAEIYNPHNLFSYAEAFRGGVYVTAGDVDKDGIDEIITAPRAGGGPQVRVFEQDGTPRGIEIWPFHPNSRTGINVAAGDVDGDGKDEIVVAQSEQGQAWVKVYRYNAEKTIIGEWNAYGQVECGASVAMGDLDYDGKDEVIVGAGPGGGPQIRTFEADGTPKSIQFFAFSQSYRGGIDVAAGDVDGDGKAEIGVTQKEEQAWTKVYRYNWDQSIIGVWKAFADFPVGGLVTMGDIDRDGYAEVVVGAGKIGGPQVRAFEADGAAINNTNFFAYSEAFRGGTDVGVAKFD